MSTDSISLARARLNRRPSWTIHRRAYHKPLQPFFYFINNGPRKAVESVWLFTPLFQVIGLVNERAEKLARAFYSACWSIIYSCFRPWTANRQALPSGREEIPRPIKNIYDANEHFRLGMGTLVSAVYGSGAFGMLLGWFKQDDDLFDKATSIYQIGMFNQNQIFASMNFADVMKRIYTPEKMSEHERSKKSPKATIEVIDSVLFLPTIIVRALDTSRLFGIELGDNIQKIINTFSYFSYGTWAARFGILKQTENKGSNSIGCGLLDPLNKHLKGLPKKIDDILHSSQKYGGRAFYTLLPALSWMSAGAEALGHKEFAKTTFKLEGILERLNPAIFSWCGRSTWLRLFEKDTKPQAHMAA
jgi:hypothetical protein